jgi:hypothetical protein
MHAILKYHLNGFMKLSLFVGRAVIGLVVANATSGRACPSRRQCERCSIPRTNKPDGGEPTEVEMGRRDVES